LVVEAGGVSAVTGVYREPLSAEPLAEGGSLYDLVRSSVEGSERTWKLSMEAVLPRDPSKIIESRNTAFKDLKEHEQVESFAPREQTNASLGQQLAARDNELSAARAELNAVRQQVTVLESAQTQFLAFLAHSGAQPDEPERAASTVADDTASEHDGSSGSVAS
jgi:hypothetical protein